MDFFKEYVRDLFLAWYSLVFGAVAVWQFIAMTWPQLHLPNVPVGIFLIVAAGCFMILQGFAYYRKWIQLIPKLEITFD